MVALHEMESSTMPNLSHLGSSVKKDPVSILSLIFGHFILLVTPLFSLISICFKWFALNPFTTERRT